MRIIKALFDKLILNNPWGVNIYILGIKFLSNKPIILFTKNHPIYTTYFHSSCHGYKYVFISNKIIHSRYFDRIANRCLMIHVDASSWHTKFIPFTKKIVAECEAYPTFLDKNSFIPKALLFQSQYAKSLTSNMDNNLVVYPTVSFPENIYNKTNKIQLLAVGYGSFIKGFDVVYAIYKALRKELDVSLYFAGAFGHNFEHYPELSLAEYEEYKFDKILEEINDDPNVEIRPHKHQDLIRTVYPNATIYLHMSRMDTFGFSILEAMAQGIPVVSVNFKAIPEMVEHNVNGFLCDPFNNEENLSDLEAMKTPAWKNKAIEEGTRYCKTLLGNEKLRLEMSLNNRKKVKKLFSHEIRREKLNEIYAL